jgi:putative glutamine amidotransferase
MAKHYHSKPMKRPLIAVPMDYLEIEHEPEAAWYSKYPWYGVKHRYHDALVKTGAIPCFIGYDHSLIPEYVNRFDGLVITGGYFDHDPEMYGAQEIHPTTKRRSSRSQFEKALLEAFLPTQKPVLGICGGHQLINIIYGGTLYQDLPSHPASVIKHTQTNPPTEAAHSIEIVEGTKLHQWYQKSQAQINSSHHQGIHHLGAGLVANALSADGLVEGLEDPTHPFCIGVQWHPEYFVDPLDQLIFEKFVSSCV